MLVFFHAVARRFFPAGPIKLCSSTMLLYVHRDRTDYGRGAQDGHLDFDTAPEL